MDLTPKEKAAKAKHKQVEINHTKILCTSKETFHNMKRQPTEWENIFGNNVPNKELIHQRIKHLHNSTAKEQTIQLENGQKL